MFSRMKMVAPFRIVAGLAIVFMAVTMLFPPNLAAANLPHQPKPNSEKRNDPKTNTKAPKTIPSKPFDLSELTLKAFEPKPAKKLSSNSAASISDTTPPSTPVPVTATSQSVYSIQASWPQSQDPESGISYYAFGIGTHSSGDYSSLADVRWWQVTSDTDITVQLKLDTAKTYYVSVYAVNGAGLGTPITTSGAIHPVYKPLAQAGYVMGVQFASEGYDADGNRTSGWTPDQITLMSSFVDKMYPILEQLYGPPADNYTVKIVRDLRYSGSNIFIPSADEIHKDDNFYPQLFTHELLHAFRNDHILSSDENMNFNSTLSGFEESFAQGVSYEAMNKYVETYPDDTIVPGNSLWGSGNDWDYDYQNMLELRGTDFWSDGGGTGLFWLRYEVGAAAIRKINLELPDFYKKFNQEYYSRINANPTEVYPTRALMVDIIKSIVPQIEGVPADQWIDKQHIFYAQNVYGKKIFHKIQDYPWTEFIAFQNMYFTDTMACGSEWSCWDGQQWVYHRLNGSSGTGKLSDNNGNTIWSGGLSITPTQNPSDGYYEFGSAAKSLTTATTLDPWPGGDPNEYILNLTNFGLYKFDSTFSDPVDGTTTSNSIYRPMGSAIANGFKGVWGGILGHKNGVIYLNHEGYPDEPALNVVNGAFQGARSWTGIYNTRTGSRDSVPGKVFISFTDSDTGVTYHAQRNIDYGNWDGSQMLLLDFTETSGDTTAPTVSIVDPSNNATVSSPSVTIAADAADDVDVTNVKFYVDGTFMSADTSSPFTASWDAAATSLGNHTITAIAYDRAGNNTTSSPVTVTLVDTTPPTVVITSPANGSIVSRNAKITMAATATDSRGISKVEFYINNSLLCTDMSVPYSCFWTVPNQKVTYHSLKAKAYDISNNSAEAISVVNLKN